VDNRVLEMVVNLDVNVVIRMIGEKCYVLRIRVLVLMNKLKMEMIRWTWLVDQFLSEMYNV